MHYCENLLELPYHPKESMVLGLGKWSLQNYSCIDPRFYIFNQILFLPSLTIKISPKVEVLKKLQKQPEHQGLTLQ